MSGSILVMPIRSGRGADFRAFIAEVMGPRRGEWAESQRRRGITRQVVSVAPAGAGEVAIIFLESTDADEALRAITASDHPFDRWLAARMAELFEPRVTVEHLADTAPRPGPWRGWRRVTR